MPPRPPPPLRCAIYACATPSDAEPQHRAEALANEVQRRGWTLAGSYLDTVDHRPRLKALQAAVMKGAVYVIMLTDICELAPDVAGIVETLAWFAERVALVSIRPPMDTGTTEGRVMLRMALHLAEHHATIRRDRQRSGKPTGGARGKS